MTLPLKVLGDRVLVKPDRNANAPEQLESGVIVATTLAAAVTGEDAVKSVTRGTVVALGTPKHPRADDVDNWVDCLAYDQFDELRDLLRDLVRREPCCQIGDDVLFSHDAGQAITLDDESYILLHESDLLAVVEPEPVGSCE